MKTNSQTLQELLARVRAAQSAAGVDLSTAEDLSVAVMNLISLEEHFFFTGAKTDDPKYFDTLAEVRSIRKKLMAELLPEHEGETWCAAKHLLASTMRLIEAGTKKQNEGESGKAVELFGEAYRLYSIFWALKLKLVEAKELGEVSECCKE
jgi:hypothetical protein